MSRPLRSSGRLQRGIALVIVLWVMALLSAMAASYVVSTRTETALARNWLEGARARWAAESGVQVAVYELLRAQTVGSAEVPWRADGTVYRVDLAGAELHLNSGQTELLDGLLGNLGLDPVERQRITDSILDWRDEDSLVHLYGAEDDDYAREGLPYGAKDGPFDSMEELLLVSGMSRQLYFQIKNDVTLFSYVSGINPVVAPREVLLALPGVDAGEVEAYIAARAQSADEGLPPPLPPLTQGRYYSAARGPVYTIRVDAVTAGGANERIETVVRLEPPRRAGNADRPFETLVWRSGLPDALPWEGDPPAVQ